ncbi:AAA family ATPase [Candidatus Bathyarchaeota archaeon]|nr:AAA family ATPase [Candidatus Bathyarchaeota archaeon]
MKIAVAGKGGVGKTLICGTLARLLARDGYSVLAVDADPAMNLAFSLGIPATEVSKIVPLTENEELISSRTKAPYGSTFGALVNLTPTVDDITEKYGIVGPDRVRLLVMGTVRSGGSGCMCPANSLVRALIRHITLVEKDVVVMDMEAGLEHLGRATVRGFNVLLCVVEPGLQSIETAARIKRLANDINVKEVVGVGNKVTSKRDVKSITESLEKIGMPLLCSIPFDKNIIRADSSRAAPIDYAPSSKAITAIKDLEKTLLTRYT